MRNAIITALLALAVLSATAATGAAASKPEARQDGDKLVLENAHVSVWFHGKKPMLKVFPAGNESGAFSYHFREVVEYRDLDNDQLPSNNEVVARLSLEKASAFEVNTSEADGVVTLNLSLRAPVKLGGPQLLENVTVPDRDAHVILSFSIRDEDVTIDAHGVELAVPATSIKYDFEVVQWPFVDAAAHRLALDMTVDGTVVPDADDDTITAAEVDANGTAVGVLAWTAAAHGRTAAGEDVEVPVRTKLVPAGEAVNATTRIVFTYDAPGLATILHDPTIGIASAGAAEEAGATLADKVNAVPGAGLLAAAGAVGLAALARRRRA